jgi:hypothetical protein
MERFEFVRSLGLSAAGIALLANLAACSRRRAPSAERSTMPHPRLIRPLQPPRSVT